MEKPPKNGLGFVRSQANLGDYKDPETIWPPSVVDSSNYVPLGEVVTRSIRGQSSNVSVSEPVFEVGPDMNPSAACDNMDPTRERGFDLADAARITASIREVAKRERDQKIAQQKEEKEKELADKKELERLRRKEKAERGEAEPAPGAPDKGAAGGK